MTTTWFLLVVGLGVAVAQIPDIPDIPWSFETPLDEYCKRDDGVFGYDALDVFEEDGATVYTFNMTSQLWMDVGFSNRYLWWHYLSIAVPNTPVITDAAYLWIEAGNMEENPPTMTNSRMRYIRDFAINTGAVAAMVRQDPNQPVHFRGDPETSVVEDSIIAKTWRAYIEFPGDDPDPDVIFQNPMTKTAYKAIDALIEITTDIDPVFNIDKIMPSGISKRGWIAWLLAGIDQRIFATAPVVLSLLNWNENLHHHNEDLGGWSYAFKPYWDEYVSGYIDHPRSYEIFSGCAIDPFSYNSRMEDIPKLWQAATGDQFFLLDDSHDFWDELKGEHNYMSMFENTAHTMVGEGPRMEANIESFFLTSYYNVGWPSLRWDRSVDEDARTGTLDMWAKGTIKSVKAWVTDNENRHCDSIFDGGVCRRDFRKNTDGGITSINWEETTFEDGVQDGDELHYTLTIPFRDDDGYRGFFFAVVFEGYDENHDIDVTTEVVVMPDTYPFDRCVGFDECQGVIK